MKLAHGPVALISTLVVVVIFFAGIKYGQNVMKVNYNVGELERLLPTYFPTPSVTMTPKPNTYELHYSEQCKISLPVSNDWDITKETSSSAQLQQHGVTQLAYDCQSKQNPYENKASKPARSVLFGSTRNTKQYSESSQNYQTTTITTDYGKLHLKINTAIAPYVEAALKIESE